MAKKVPVRDEDRKKSYFKYYLEDIEMGPKDKYDAITQAPLDNAKALHINDRNDLFNPGDLPGEFGWWQLDDGTALIANQTFFEGVTGEMFDWWFAWHSIDRLRYAIWDSEDHYDVYLDNPARAQDMGLSMRERHWNSVHNTWEDIGLGQVDLLRIHFRRPGDMGYDESKLDTDACNALVCANVKILGSQLRSRFWFGWQIVDGVAVKSIPDGVKVPAAGPVCLLNHNVKEFSNLARLLPRVYAEEKDNWF